MTLLNLTADDVRDALALPLATSAEVEHLNTAHPPIPYDLAEEVVFPDGCTLTPVYPGCHRYYRPDEVEA